MNRGTTIVLCFSRTWCIRDFFKAFDKLMMRKKSFHLLVFDNTDNINLQEALLKATKKYMFKFRSYRYYKSYRGGGQQRMSDMPGPIEKSKIPSIIDMNRDIVEMVKTPIMLQFEDDTLMPPNAVKRLLHILKNEKDCAFATACATGRARFKINKVRLGLSYLKRDWKNKPFRMMERLSLSPHHTGLVDVDGCGIFCFATYIQLWREMLHTFPKNLTGVERWGADLMLTNLIRCVPLRVIADFDLWCEHMQLSDYRILYWQRFDAVPMLDIWLPDYEEYAQGVILSEEKYKRLVKRFI